MKMKSRIQPHQTLMSNDVGGRPKRALLLVTPSDHIIPRAPGVASRHEYGDLGAELGQLERT